MGIRLDWEVESYQTEARRAGEDPARRRARRLAQVRLMLSILVLLALAGAAALWVTERLRQAEAELSGLLRDTVEAEVATLRLGDLSDFLAFQRSATDDWLRAQEATFHDYQRLKRQTDIEITGTVRDITLDGQRGRVMVEEIIDGVPYTRVWYYWRYEDGWHHVPPDYEFWGEEREIDRRRFAIRYRAVDEIFAQQMAASLDAWLGEACGFLNCGQLPFLTVDVVASPLPEITPANGNPWQLIVPSPYVDRARSDQPFDLEYRLEMADLLANRLVDHASGYLSPAYPADAYYLRSAVVSWLVGRFVQINTNSFLIDSLAQQYEPSAVGALLRTMQPDSSMAVFAQVTGAASLAQTGLDWRDWLTWRLVLEDQLIANRDEANWLQLVDTRTEALRQSAYQRFNANAPAENKVVVDVTRQTAEDGVTPQLRAQVQVGSEGVFRYEYVLFNLVDNVWRRAG